MRVRMRVRDMHSPVRPRRRCAVHARRAAARAARVHVCVRQHQLLPLVELSLLLQRRTSVVLLQSEGGKMLLLLREKLLLLMRAQRVVGSRP